MTTKKSTSTNASGKSKFWAIIGYPDSLPKGWKDRLETQGLVCAISPLHDNDLWTEADEDENPKHKAGTHKKDHYHILLAFNGPTTYNSVKRISDELGQPKPILVANVKGYYRYLCHLDNPEKAIYNVNEIAHINGFKVTDYIEATSEAEDELIDLIEDIIESQDIIEYYTLMKTLRGGGESLKERVKYARNHTLYFDAYIRSRRYATNRGYNPNRKDTPAPASADVFEGVTVPYKTARDIDDDEYPMPWEKNNSDDELPK